MKSCGICFCYMRILQKSDTTGETSTSKHQLRCSCTAEHLSSIKSDDDAIQLLNWQRCTHSDIVLCIMEMAALI